MRCCKFDWVRRVSGLDQAVAYTVASRLLQIFGSIGTVLLIFRFLSPIEQGYYYTLLSLAALQTIFELGFSFVILQMAAHESGLLSFGPKGEIEGDQAAFSRLASVLRLTVKWYAVAAMAFAVLLVSAGWLFFHKSAQTSYGVFWIGPWISTVLAVAMTLFLTPLYSLIEGCQQVRQIARMRAEQALAAFLCSWGAISMHHGLYASAFVNIGVIAVGGTFLYRRRALLTTLWRQPDPKSTFSWRRDVWPFQWKIAISWLCSYFMMQVFTPVLFAYRGPLEAGRMGISLSIAGYLPALALSWITPKAAPFGQLVKLGRLRELDTRFFKAFFQALGVILTLDAVCFLSVLTAHSFLPRIAARMESPALFVILLAAVTGGFVIQGMAVYLRSFKREPFLVQSITVSTCTLGLIALLAPRWGGTSVATVYCSANCLIGVPWAAFIFKAQRKARRENATRKPTIQTSQTVPAD